MNPIIKKLEGYGPLASNDIELLEATCANSRRVAARQDLIREGDRPGPVFVILEGWAYRYKILPEGGRQVMAFLMPGDFCDLHIAVLAEMDHNIGTLTRARVAMIPRERIAALLESNVGLQRAFWWTQLVDEGVLRSWIVNLGRRDSHARIAHLMCELYVRAHNIGLVDQDGACEMPVSQLVLADAVGLTPVHINRVFRWLRIEKILTIGHGRLVVTDLKRLVRIAGFDENYLHRKLRAVA